MFGFKSSNDFPLLASYDVVIDASGMKFEFRFCMIVVMVTLVCELCSD
jgi:hypothetical protein